MLFEISEEKDKRLNELPLLDYLNYMHDYIERIKHQKKTNSAYNECRAYSHHVMWRLVKEFKINWDEMDKNPTLHHLRLSRDILDMYSHRDSDKNKEYRIREFVNEFTYDMKSYIMALERRKDDPRAASEENPV